MGYGFTAHTATGAEVVGIAETADATIENAIVERTISGTYSNSEVTILREQAFRSCASLTSVDLPNVSVIGSLAFAEVPITSIEMSNVTTINTQAFMNC